MKLTKEDCLDLGVKYILTYKCYPSAKGWSIKTAGCSRDRIYDHWESWVDFTKELACKIEVPKRGCLTSPGRRAEEKNKPCFYCSELTYARNKYCSNKCQANHKYDQKVKQLLDGEFSNKYLKGGQDSWLRKFMISVYGETCSSCGVGNIYNNKQLVLEIDHINGRCHNNVLSNLRFLCPNCHSQTDNYKAKNLYSDNILRYKNNPIQEET